MKKLTIAGIAAACLLLSSAIPAQTKPRWVQKGVKSLNKERIDKNYRFCEFTTSGTDVTRLQADRFQPLLEYIGAQYGANPDMMQLDSVEYAGRTTYRISFLSGGQPAEVQAQRIDAWSQLDDNIGISQMQLSQLYAVSDKDASPVFDHFTLTDRYGAKPAWMSIIPGVGQIYKGQAAKGYTLLGVEAALIGASIGTAIEMNRYKRLEKNDPGNKPSWDSNISTFRTLRNASLIIAGGIYIYNLIDAAVAKGARRVLIKQPDNRNTAAEISFAPALSPFGVGMGAVVRF